MLRPLADRSPGSGCSVANFRQIIDTVGTGSVLAAMIPLVAALASGYLFGGPTEDKRSVMGLRTAQRNS